MKCLIIRSQENKEFSSHILNFRSYFSKTGRLVDLTSKILLEIQQGTDGFKGALFKAYQTLLSP